jgi:hypothetical protein
MLQTYKAILRGNRLEWSDAPPATVTTDRPIAVHVTILDSAPATEQTPLPGQHMAAILEQLAQQHTLDATEDAAEWERNIRIDRELPGREN